jgi:3-oxoacyl-[acyl-carrier-protein] synthase II
MSQPAAITGLGAVSGFGIGVEPLWAGLLAGERALLPRRDGAEHGIAGLPLSLVALPGPDGTAPGLATAQVLWDEAPRATQMIQLAGDEAMRAAGLIDKGLTPSTSGPLRLGICLGTTHGEKAPWLASQRRKNPFNAAAELGVAQPAYELARRYQAEKVQVLCAACASGNVALACALGWIRSGRCDVVLCGGGDALHDFVLRGFQCLRALSPQPCMPFDANRSGLSLGEGAAFVVIESLAQARRRGQPVLALLRGSGQSCDANHMTGPDRKGRGAARAMLAALADAALAPSDIDFVSAHGTATPFNDQMEGQAIAATFGEHAARLPVHSIKGAIGHSMGAAAAIEAVVAVRALQAQCVPGTTGLSLPDPAIPLQLLPPGQHALRLRHVISTASGFGGLNAAVILSATESLPEVEATR